MNQRLAKLGGFFHDNSDFSKVEKPNDVLELPFISLKAVDPSWVPFIEELDVTSIKDVAEYKEPIEVEGLDPEELNKAVLIADMIYWHVKNLLEKGDQKKKIVLVGLDNAGKTTLITTLSEKYSAIRQLLPTRGLARQSINLFGYEISTFDLGGQADYRKGYFEKADMVFTATDLILYCIDIQDPNRFQESLDYLKKILTTCANLKLNPPVLLVFTKTDPDVSTDETLNKHRIELIDKIETLAQEFGDLSFDVGYANSSIYERNSIENLFSLALKRISVSNAVIEAILKEFMEDIEAQAVGIVSTAGLIFGSYGKSKKEEELLTNTAIYLQNLYLFHLGEGMQREESYIMEYPRNHIFFIADHIVESDSGIVYLWVMTTNLRKQLTGFPKLKDELLPLIDNFL
jgi:small GTP-binding protein